jgi:hypothetical protein
MAINLSNLTDSAQKEYSKYIKDINHQKGVIEKCKAYIKQCPSDALKRAKAGYEHNKRQVEDHDSIIESRIRKQEEQNELDIQAAKDAAAKKIRDIIKAGDESLKAKEKYLSASEEKLESLENLESKTEVNARIELEKLTKAFESFKLRVQPTPQVTQPLPVTQPPEEQSEKPNNSEVSDSEMLKALREEYVEKPLTFMTNNFSYCGRSEAKEKYKGMQGLISAGTNYDSNIYGPVSTLTPKKGIKLPASRLNFSL